MAFNEGQIRPPSFSAVVGIVVGLAVLVFVSASVVIVPAGERAVIFDNLRGVLPDVRNEGMTFVLPFVQKAVRYDVRTHTYNLGTNDADAGSGGASEAAIDARTKDGQTVRLELSVRYQPRADDLWKLHQEVGQTYLYKIIVPEVRSVVRTIVAQYDVMDVYSSKRLLIQGRIEESLRKTFD